MSWRSRAAAREGGAADAGGGRAPRARWRSVSPGRAPRGGGRARRRRRLDRDAVCPRDHRRHDRGRAGHETTSFKAGFIPRSVDGRTDVEGFSFGFIADRAASLRGAQLSLGYNQVDGNFRGLQVTTAVNVAGRFTSGAQLAAGANLAAGSGHGAQLAAGANVFDGDFRGWQTAAGVNVTTGRFHGLQSAAGLNLTDEGSGLQLPPEPTSPATSTERRSASSI